LKTVSTNVITKTQYRNETRANPKEFFGIVL